MGEIHLYRYKNLPDKLFKVKVPVISTYSDYDIKRGAINKLIINYRNDVSSEYITDIESNNYSQKDLVIVKISIRSMIETFKKGYPIYVINDEDVVNIYNILEDYYSGSGAYPEELFNSAKYIDRDIPLIDSFLDMIFKNHKLSIARSKIKITNNGDFGNRGFLDYKAIAKGTEKFYNAPIVKENTGIIKGYNLGYIKEGNQSDNSESNFIKRGAIESHGYVEMKTTANVLRGNYINMNTPEIDLSKLENLKRPDRPGIDIEEYKSKMKRNMG